jgi:hypothetical protein
MVLFLAASLVLPLEPACHDISYDRKHAEIRRNSSNTAASMTPTIILLGAWIGRGRIKEREREQRYDTEEFYYQIRVAFCYNIHEWISSSGSLLLKGSFGRAGHHGEPKPARPIPAQLPPVAQLPCQAACPSDHLAALVCSSVYVSLS